MSKTISMFPFPSPEGCGNKCFFMKQILLSRIVETSLFRVEEKVSGLWWNIVEWLDTMLHASA
jgi:hypothetical protein